MRFSTLARRATVAGICLLMFLDFVVVGLVAIQSTAILLRDPAEGGLWMGTARVTDAATALSLGGIASIAILSFLKGKRTNRWRIFAVLYLGSALTLLATWHVLERTKEAVTAAFQATPAGDQSLLDALAEQHELESQRAKLGTVDAGLHSRLADLREQTTAALEALVQDPSLVACQQQAHWPICGLYFLLALWTTTAYAVMISAILRHLDASDRANPPGHALGPIRAVGTIGFIVAGVILGWHFQQVSAVPFLIAAVVSGLLALLACLLPAAPTTPAAERPATLESPQRLGAWAPHRDWIQVIRSCGVRFFLVVVLCAVAVRFHEVLTHTYLVDIRVPRPGAVFVLAQVLEIGLLIGLGHLSRLGPRWLFASGPGGLMVLYLLLAVQSTWPAGLSWLCLALMLQGFNALLGTGATLHVDAQVPPQLRETAQGLISAVQGLGVLAGTQLVGWVVSLGTASQERSWGFIWLTAGALAFLTTLIALWPAPAGRPAKEDSPPITA